MTGPSTHILVDANIARSAADPARHPVSRSCYALASLLRQKDCRTGLAMTPALLEEWRTHASRTMTAWLVEMEQRGRVRRKRDRRVQDLRVAVSHVSAVGVRDALAKDIHISEAAILNGYPVASRDDRQKGFLAELSRTYALAGRVQWMNPVSDLGWSEWVQSGCSDNEAFQIGTSTSTESATR